MAGHHKPKSPSQHGGFTIVELLIVIVVIAILAAITIVAYNGITQKAHQSALQSDLAQSATVLGIAKTTNDSYPANLASANLPSSPGNTYTYNVAADGSSYCLIETGYGMTYSITSDNPSPQVGFCNGGYVTTLAGNGTIGYVDATGSAAEFSAPKSLAIDASGVIYVLDRDNYRIRKVTSSGVVTTFVGSGTAGYTNATGTSAQFAEAYGLAFDAAGNLYLADSANNRIREITSAGAVTTFAGQTAAGFTNATGASAQFDWPAGVTVDASGNLYIVDESNNCIRKITPAGVVTTFAGQATAGYANGTGTSAQFNNPRDIAIDSSGTLYVADAGNNRIRKITSSGVVTTLAGSGATGNVDGMGTAAQFNGPVGIAVDTNGTVYVADSDNNTIRSITPAGLVSTLAGNGTAGFADGTGSSSEFNKPSDVVVDATGNIYVADTSNERIRVIK